MVPGMDERESEALDQVRVEAAAMWTAEQRQKMLVAKANELVAEANKTQSLDAAAALAGRAPAAFSYRGLSPLSAGDRFKVAAARNADGIVAWTENAAGALCMEAHATF